MHAVVSEKLRYVFSRTQYTGTTAICVEQLRSATVRDDHDN